jgi:hypothetical protein
METLLMEVARHLARAIEAVAIGEDRAERA